MLESPNNMTVFVHWVFWINTLLLGYLLNIRKKDWFWPNLVAIAVLNLLCAAVGIYELAHRKWLSICVSLVFGGITIILSRYFFSSKEHPPSKVTVVDS